MLGGQIGQDLTINRDIRLAEHSHKSGIGYSFPVYTSSDPGYPERAKVPFSQFASAIRFRHRSHDGFTGGAVKFTPSTSKSFSLFSYFLPALMAGWRCLDFGHDLSSLEFSPVPAGQ